jgi:LPXTG-site transpeptidase (sortase) family protein
MPSASVGTEVPAGPAVFVPARVVLADGTVAPVVPVGLRADGSLVIPDDVRTVGWWTGGSKAGEAFGSVVIAGHVDSAARGIGVFAELKHLSAGQVVTLGAGTQQARYRIFSATRVPQAEISQAAGIFAVDGEARLVLITCGGPFDPVRHRYQDNLVVVATPLT